MMTHLNYISDPPKSSANGAPSACAPCSALCLHPFSDFLVHLEELRDASIDANALPLVQIRLGIPRTDALCVA